MSYPAWHPLAGFLPARQRTAGDVPLPEKTFSIQIGASGCSRPAACILLAVLIFAPARGASSSTDLSIEAMSPSQGAFGLGLSPAALGELARAVPSGFQEPPRPLPPVRPELHPVPPVLLRNEDRSFGRMFLRGEAIIGSVELGSLIILALMPQSTTQWDDRPFNKAAQNLKRAWTQPPVWDKDIWFHNYVGHPYAGSIYYNMVRSQGATPLQSFFFSTIQCVLFEYLAEAVAERPSKQDLLITSTVGSILGELFHRLALGLMKKERLTFLEKVVLLVTNPSFVVNNGFSPPRRPY